MSWNAPNVSRYRILDSLIPIPKEQFISEFELVKTKGLRYTDNKTGTKYFRSLLDVDKTNECTNEECGECDDSVENCYICLNCKNNPLSNALNKKNKAKTDDDERNNIEALHATGTSEEASKNQLLAQINRKIQNKLQNSQSLKTHTSRSQPSVNT